MTLKDWQPTTRLPYIRKMASKAQKLKDRGYPVAVIADRFGVSRLTVYRWLYFLKANPI
jgi:transposase